MQITQIITNIALIKHCLVRISCKFQEFPQNFAFSMAISSNIAALVLRIFYKWHFSPRIIFVQLLKLVPHLLSFRPFLHFSSPLLPLILPITYAYHRHYYDIPQLPHFYQSTSSTPHSRTALLVLSYLSLCFCRF